MDGKYFAIAFVIAGIFGTAITIGELPKVFGYYQYGKVYSEDPYQQQEQSNENKQYEYDDYNDNNNEYDYGSNNDGFGYEYKKEYKKEYRTDKDNAPVFIAKINGENLRPEPTDSPIYGFGKVKVEEKPSTDQTQLTYEVSVFNVPKDDDLIAVHIHVIEDEQTQIGPHIITLCGNPLNEIECPEGPGVIAAGAAIDRDIETEEQDIITNMDELVEALKEGRGYIQIHTTDFPDGAVRGDLIEKRNNDYNNYKY